MDDRCPLCRAAAFRAHWSWAGSRSGCCQNCGHVYSVVPASVSYADFQQHYPDAYLLDADIPMARLARERAQHIGQGPGRALEIGSGYGHFLRELRSAGWDASGIEPSLPAAAFARDRLGVPVLGRAYHVGIAGDGFDLIAAFHVLEHVADPREFLRQIAADLRDGGTLAIAVPDLRTLPRDFIELVFIARGLHRHTFHPARLVQLLVEEQFAVQALAEEAPNTMSPSSCLVLATKASGPSSSLASAIPAEECCAMARTFHADMDRMRERLQTAVAGWRAEGKSVAFYGAGLHTDAVLELCGLGQEQVRCVVDDDPLKQGRLLGGIPVVGPEEDCLAECSIILVSTLASEGPLVKKLKRRWPEKAIYGVYRDFGNV